VQIHNKIDQRKLLDANGFTNVMGNLHNLGGLINKTTPSEFSGQTESIEMMNKSMSILDDNDMCKSFDASNHHKNNKSGLFSIDKERSAKLSLAISQQNKSVDGALGKYQMPKLEFDTQLDEI